VRTSTLFTVRTMPSAFITPRTTAKNERRFVVRYRNGGRGFPIVHAGSFQTLKEARARRDLVAGELAAGRNPADTLRAPVETAERRTFKQWADAYQSSRVDLGTASLKNMRTHLNAMDCFADRDPTAITTADVAEWIAGLELAPSSVAQYVGTLRVLLDFANVDPNPARDRRVRLPAVVTEEPNPPTAKQLLAILDKLPARWVLPLVVLEQTGMRIGEAVRLTWGDVDVAESRFRLPRRSTKTKRPRWVQVPRWLMDELEQLCPLEDRTAERRLFQITGDGCKNAMTRACLAAGVPHFHPHDLRHRRLSLWHGQGVPARELADRAGHARASMSLDVYSHVLMDDTEVTSDEFLSLINR
jgi:integrase